MYRKEALEKRKSIWKGSALLLPGFSPWLSVLACLLFTTLFTLMITYGTYTRRVTVSGEITSLPRAINIYSDIQGVITNRYISNGMKVNQNDPLFRIDVSKSNNKGNISAQQRDDILKQISQIKDIIQSLNRSKEIAIKSLEIQKEQYKQAHDHSLMVLHQAEENIAVSKKNLENYKEYLSRRLITKGDLLNQESLYYQQQNNIFGLKNQNIQNAIQLTNIESQIQIQAAEFENRIYQSNLQLYELKKELINTEKESAIIVRSLSEGKVDSVNVSVGQMVSPGNSLVRILPESISGYYLVLWVPNTAVPYISTGDKVNISYEAFPVGKFGQFSGVIQSISRSPATSQEMSTYQGAPQPSASESNPYYKVLVKPKTQGVVYNNKLRSLEDGMKAQVTLFLEKRNIWQWLLSPLYEIRRSTKGPISE